MRTGGGTRNLWAIRLAAFAVVVLIASAAASATSAGGPHMLVGAVEPSLLGATLPDAETQLGLARAAGLGDVVRVQVTWARGRTAPEQSTVDRLRNAVSAGANGGAAVYVSLYPYGSTQTPLSDADQNDFATWVAAIARAVPQGHHYIIGNEPNLNRFWLPQFGPNGEDVAAPAYVSLLARTYDALKVVSPSIEVLGGALSHAGIDRPGTRRDTHSPTAFIQDMGTAYRASGRDRPIMDAFTFHPYMLRSDQPPTTQHPTSTTITIADYDKLVQLLGAAFDGTAQQGSDLPIVYDEFGVESTIPSDKLGIYTGSEPATVHPVDDATQAAYYTQALQLAFCQPNVKAFLVFSLEDEANLAGWQSGVYYADGTPKASLPQVEAAANRARRNVIATCPGLEVTPKLRLRWFPDGRPGPGRETFAPAVTCDVDCAYVLQLEKLPAASTTLESRGTATGRVSARIELGQAALAPGSYRYTIWAQATQNAGPPVTETSPEFTIPKQ